MIIRRPTNSKLRIVQLAPPILALFVLAGCLGTQDQPPDAATGSTPSSSRTASADATVPPTATPARTRPTFPQPALRGLVLRDPELTCGAEVGRSTALVTLSLRSNAGTGPCVGWVDEFETDAPFLVRFWLNGDDSPLTYQTTPGTTSMILPPGDFPRVSPLTECAPTWDVQVDVRAMVGGETPIVGAAAAVQRPPGCSSTELTQVADDVPPVAVSFGGEVVSVGLSPEEAISLAEDVAGFEIFEPTVFSTRASGLVSVSIGGLSPHVSPQASSVVLFYESPITIENNFDELLAETLVVQQFPFAHPNPDGDPLNLELQGIEVWKSVLSAGLSRPEGGTYPAGFVRISYAVVVESLETTVVLVLQSLDGEPQPLQLIEMILSLFED